MSRVNSSDENAAEVSENEISTPKSTKESQTASCQDLDLSLNRVSPIHTSEASIGKISRSAISSLSKLIAGDITSYISITEDRINLTFSFPKSDFGQMSLAVLQELGKADSNKGENDKHEVSKTQKSALANGSDTERRANTTLCGETLNRSFLSEIAHRCDINNSEDILSAFMKESDVSNPEIDRSECPKGLKTNSREFSTSSNGDHETEEMNSKIDKSFGSSRQDSRKTSSKDASNTSIGTPDGKIKRENSRIYSQEATSEVCITDAGNSKSDDTNMNVSAVSVQMTPKPRKSLEFKVDPTRSASIEFGCSTTEEDKDNGYIPKPNNDLKDKMVVPEHSTLNSKSETGVVKDNAGCDLTVCVTKNSSEIEKTNAINKNSATNLKTARVPNSQEMSSTASESGGIEILAKSSLYTSLKTKDLRDYSGRADEKGSFEGDNKQTGEHISTNSLKSDVWPEIIPFAKIYKIPAKEIESRVSTDSAIKYFQLELPGRCIVVKTILEGVKDISVEIGEYKESDLCSRSSFEAASERMGSLGVTSKTQMSDKDAEMKMVQRNISEQPNEQVYFSKDEISTPLLHETTRVQNEKKETKIILKIHSLSELEIDVDSEDYNTLDKGELSNKSVSRHTSNIIQCDATEYLKEGDSNLEKSNESIYVVSQHTGPPYDTDESEQNSPETSCNENLSPSTSDTATPETSAFRTFSETPASNISGDKSDRKTTVRVQSTRSLEGTLLNTSDKYQRVSHTSTPSRTPKRLSLMFGTEVTNNETEKESLPGEMLGNQSQETLSFKNQSVAELASHEFTGTITGEVSCSTTTVNEPVRDELISSSSLLTANGNSVDVSTLPASVVDNATATSSMTSIDDSGNATPSTFEEENISSAVIEGQAMRSPAVEDEVISTFAAVEDEAPTAAIDHKDSTRRRLLHRGAVEDEDVSACGEIEDKTLLSPPKAIEYDSQTSAAVSYDKTSSVVHDEASKSPTPATKSEAEDVENGAASLSQTDDLASAKPSSPQYSGSTDPVESGSDVILPSTEAEVNPDSSSPTSSKIPQTVEISPAVDRSDAEADRLTEQSGNPSSAEGQSEEDEISAGPSAESNEETAAESSSVTSTVEDPDTVDSASSDATESSSSSKWEEVSRYGVSNGVRSEDDSSKGTETSDEACGEPKEISHSQVERAREKGGMASITDTGKSKSSSRAKRNLKDIKRSSLDEVDLAPTRARSRNLPSSLWKDSIPENSAVTGKYEKHVIRASSSSAKQTSPSKRNLRSKSLDPSPTKTPTKSSSRKAVSGKPAPLENEAVARVKRSESASDRDAKSKVRSSPRKARTAVTTLEATKSSGEDASESQSAKSRSTSNAAFMNIRRSKRGAKD